MLPLGEARANTTSHDHKHAAHHAAASRHQSQSQHLAAGGGHHHARLAGAGHHSRTHATTRLAGGGHKRLRTASAHYRHSYLQCVPYAREVSHIELSGNAFLWWAEAAGRYARGDTPQQGAVLNFRSIRRMPLGHVAVVTSVIDNRTVMVTQANWIPGTITNDVTVADVSPNNDWSQVQVELGDGQKLGAAYPTYGFIYNQPDNGTVIASAGTAGGGVANSRTITDGLQAQGNEVAEAPRPAPVSNDSPDRNLQ
jgi:surface antigen